MAGLQVGFDIHSFAFRDLEGSKVSLAESSVTHHLLSTRLHALETSALGPGQELYTLYILQAPILGAPLAAWHTAGIISAASTNKYREQTNLLLGVHCGDTSEDTVISASFPQRGEAGVMQLHHEAGRPQYEPPQADMQSQASRH